MNGRRRARRARCALCAPGLPSRARFAPGRARGSSATASSEASSAADLVAQPPGLLEFEIGGGLAHALFEIGEHGLDVVAGEKRRVFGQARRHRHVVLLVDGAENVGDAALDGFGRDAVRGVVGALLLAPPVGLGDGALHAPGHAVGIENDAAFDVARRPPDGLDERGFGAQEALLVGVENGHQRAFGNVEPLAQQVDAHQARRRRRGADRG